jgi:hypothetical protein
VIAKHTPRIWDQLTSAEKARIDLIMKATFVANAFTTSDNNPFVKADGQEYALDGDDNLNRDWNPNYREGMIGGVLVGMAYFGGPASADAVLASYSHSAFVAELAANNLPNIYETFNWNAANSSSPAPSGSAIETGVRTYRYYGSGLSNYMKIYEALLNDTYGKNVNAGLNGGAGINGAGKIVSGAETLPNPGVIGMLKEFASSDANGARSSFIYAFDGYRPHMTNQLALIVGGYWTKDTAIADKAAARMNIGNTDLWYKAEKGYIGYAKGKAQTTVTYPTHTGTYGFVYNRALWDDVLRPFHDLPDTPTEPPAEFAAGARIVTSTSASVRTSASASASVVATLPTGAFGTIQGGPIAADGIEWWQVAFDSGATGWIGRTAFSAAAASEYLTATAGGGWRNRAIDPQTGSFTISFNLWAGATGIDAVAGLSTSSAAAYSDLAVAVRFSPAGTFDARNGSSYQATTALAYQAGVTYRVNVTVNLATRRYSATVTAPGGTPVEIARDFAFRTEQASASTIANLAATAQSGTFTVSGVSLQGSSAPPSAPTGLRIIGQ